MDREVARRTLNEHLASFRTWTYTELASKIDETRRKHDCLHATTGRVPDGEEYFVEINVFWDDKPGGDVRVIGDLSSLSSPRPGCLFGLLPFNAPDVTATFIVAADGSFVDE